MIKSEYIFKIVELTLSFLGLVLICFGWIVPYQQSKKRDEERQKFESEQQKIQREFETKLQKEQWDFETEYKEKQQKIDADFRRMQWQFDSEFQKRKWEKELIDTQISQLYGPLDGLIKQRNILWEIILSQLGRNYIFRKDQFKITNLAENEQKIWIHFVDNYIIPSQMKMMQIIQENQHLFYKSKYPACFNTFAEYALGWELMANQKRSGVPNRYEYFYRYNYPQEFTEYISNTLQALLKRQSELIETNHVAYNPDPQ